MKTVPGVEEELVVLFMLVIFLKWGRRNDGQSRGHNLTVFSVHKLRDIAQCRAVDYGCNVGHAIHLRALEQVLEEPEAQVGLNLVCPTTRKEYVMLVCRPVITRHMSGYQRRSVAD